MFLRRRQFYPNRFQHCVVQRRQRRTYYVRRRWPSCRCHPGTLCHPGCFVEILNQTYQLQFNPMKPHLLYAAYRGCGTGLVYSWDIRSDVNTPLEIFQVSSVAKAKSDVRTNQKMRFDIDIGGRFLSIGDQVRDFHMTHKPFFDRNFCRWARSLSST